MACTRKLGLIIALLCALAAFVFFACPGTIGIKLKAEKFGDLTDPLGPRARPDQAFVEACGLPESELAPTDLLREPYLQKTDARSTSIVWTSKSASSARVIVRDADGRVLQNVDAKIDRSARLKNAHQKVAELRNLEPSTVYCYEIVEDGQTPARGFRTAPSEDSVGPVRFIAFGDSGTGEDAQYTLTAQMQTVPFDLMIGLGDLAYDSGTLDEFESNFFAVYAELLRNFPMFPASGNHEYRTDEARVFREVFVLPENGGEKGKERWYSFDYGPVHFVALDTEWIGSAQADWLRRDLAKNTRPWVVVYGHRPAYASGHHGSDENIQEVFGPIFREFRVPVVFAGHEHHYERSKPIDGTVYIVTGGGGKDLRAVGASDFTAFSESVLHFVHVTVEKDEMKIYAVDATGQEFDSVVIKKDDYGNFMP